MSFLLRSTANLASRLRTVISQQTPALLSSSAEQTRYGLPTVFARHRGTTGFFGHLTQESLWKSATSVSNAGRKRGRARGRKMIKNLNRGQQLGVGETNMVWPGLNAPLFRGREPVVQRELPHDPTHKEKIYKMRDSIEKFRQMKVTPMDRGWSGTKMPGRSIGPPDPVGDEKFDQFDCRVLEMKQVANMTGRVGRVRRFSILVVTGNKNGLVATGMAKAVEARVALKKARNLSIRKLRYVELFEGRTVYHDFHHVIDSTAVFVQRKPEGYGFVGHRAIKTICDVIGIRDLYAKVEGTPNMQKLVKCFLAGLEKQETHGQLSDRTGLHVVEFKDEKQQFPHVLASPVVRPVRQSPEEIGPMETVKFTDLYSEGKVRLVLPKRPPFYTSHPSWQKKLRQMERTRNWDKMQKYHWVRRELKSGEDPFYAHFIQPDKGHLPFSKPNVRDPAKRKEKTK